MHPFITIDEMEKLTDFELLVLEAHLRDAILTLNLSDENLTRCLASLTNAVFVRQRRPHVALNGIGAP